MNIIIMQKKCLAIFLFMLTTLSVTSGCTWVGGIVHRIDINQGNFVAESAIEQLRFGMTQEQVIYVLGSPMLVESGYPDTWYYTHWNKEGHDKPVVKSLILKFDDKGELMQMSGDFPPSKRFYNPIGDLS